jgi:hypothetical protein
LFLLARHLTVTGSQICLAEHLTIQTSWNCLATVIKNLCVNNILLVQGNDFRHTSIFCVNTYLLGLDGIERPPLFATRSGLPTDGLRPNGDRGGASSDDDDDCAVSVDAGSKSKELSPERLGDLQ